MVGNALISPATVNVTGTFVVSTDVDAPGLTVTVADGGLLNTQGSGTLGAVGAGLFARWLRDPDSLTADVCFDLQFGPGMAFDCSGVAQ
jgi:hypothetical protein